MLKRVAKQPKKRRKRVSSIFGELNTIFRSHLLIHKFLCF
jgi:hypothetical protein